jgi:membrane-associated phospholipid phosphatase
MQSVKRILLLLFLPLLFVGSNTFSQNTIYTDYSYKPDKNYFKSYLTASKKIAISPARWNKKQWIIAGSVVTVGAIIYTFDEEIQTFFQSNKTEGSDFAAKYIFEPWGSGLYPAILIGGFYVYGLSTKDLRARQIALGAAQAFIISGITVEILKHLTHHHRPYQDIPPNSKLWEGPFKGFEYTSFPSGHAITAFTMASFFSSVYKDKLWVGIVAYGLATGVGLQRIYDNQHWASDVFIGAALGVAIGKAIYLVMDKDSRLSMGFSDTGGVALVYHIK